MLNIELKEKVAVITGGAKGIGAGIARVLAKAGSHICVIDMADGTELVKELQKEGTEAKSWKCDVTNTEQVNEVTQSIVSKFGKIDILVTSAGTTSRLNVDQLPFSEWQRILNINLNGTFNVIKSALPFMLSNKSGVIIMIGSAAIVAGSGGGVHYAASKSALEGLNRGLTRELAPKGIRTNLIHPSLIDTELLRQRHPDPDLRAKLAQTEVPLGRLGTPEDIAYLAGFLASDLGSYITGQSIFIDGGRTFCK